MEVGEEEVEASRGGVDLILSGESPSRRSGGARPCCDPGRGTGGKTTRGGAGLDQLEWAEARARHCALGPVHSGLCFYTFVLFSIFIFLFSFLFYLF